MAKDKKGTREDAIARMRLDALRLAIELLTRRELEDLALAYGFFLDTQGIEMVRVTVDKDAYEHGMIMRGQAANAKLYEECKRIWRDMMNRG